MPLVVCWAAIVDGSSAHIVTKTHLKTRVVAKNPGFDLSGIAYLLR
jgi:hypothetical protein